MDQKEIELLLNTSTQRFIHENEYADERSLVLNSRMINGLPSSLVAQQIIGRRKAKRKLPSFYNTSGIIYPPTVNVEQCSSEATAKFKSEVVVAGKKFIDLTGGFGVDTLFLSRVFGETTYIEPDNDLLNIARHNHKILGAHNIHYQNEAAEKFISNSTDQFNFIFIDPSRRSAGNKRLLNFSDCLPNVIEIKDALLKMGETIMIKASPLLDIQRGLKELKSVKKVVILSVDNECKELLFICEKFFNDEPLIEAVNILSEQEPNESFIFTFSEERNASVCFSDPLRYLYEPNASLQKAGAFKSIGVQFQLNKIHPNTHLYTGDVFMPKFPGRIFEIESFATPDIKTLQMYFPERKANITTRNYPLSVDQLKQKTKLKDGGEKFLFGFSGRTAKYLAIASRLK